MEEKPPTHEGDVPRARTPRATFSTPEKQTPPSTAAERTPRRAAKAPPVTFKPPAVDDEPTASPETESPGRSPRKTPSSTAASAPTATPVPEQPRSPRKSPPRKTAASAKAAPAKGAPAKGAPAKAAPAKGAPAKGAPAKGAPAEMPARHALEETATPPSPAKRAPRRNARSSTAAPPEVAAPAKAVEAETPAEVKAPVEVQSRPHVEAPAEIAPQRTEAWAKLVADPGHAPELMALAAVQTAGPRAREWVARIHEQYPTATDHAVARLAIQQFTRLGSVSGMFGAAAGSYAPIGVLGAAALTHAELVLHVAAAYGHDPAAEDRAADLLVLTRVHPDRDSAQAVLAAAKQPAYEEDAKVTDAVWRFGRMAMAQAGVWTAIRLVNRLFPGTSLLAATLASRSSAEAVAARARALYSRECRYSQDSQAFGNAV